jgi:hypothetical protein
MNAKTRNWAGLTAAAVVVVLALAIIPSNAVAQSTSFGSQVKIGDSDFIPGLTPLTSVFVLRLALGTTNNIQDDGFYLAIRNAGTFPTSVGTYDLRLVKVGSNNAGTLVMDADTAEKGVTAGFARLGDGAGAGSGSPKLVYADVNNDGRYNQGDWVYITFGTGTCAFLGTCHLNAPTMASDNATAWTIRLTDVSSTLKAGSIVFASDSDFTSWNTATKQLPSADLTAASATIFNADLSGGTTATTATLTPGDTVYVSPTNVTTAGSTPPLFSIRLFGDAPPGRGVTTSSSPPPTSDTTDETSDTSSPVTTTSSPPPTTTSSPAPTTTKKTPGLGLAGLIGALGAGMAIVVALRRKD